MRPWIGVPAWYKSINKGIRGDLAKARSLGARFLELSIDYPWPYRGYRKLIELAQLAREHEVAIAIHAPWRDLSLASPIESIRTASLNEVIRAISSVKGAGIEPIYVVVHLATAQKRLDSESRVEILDAARRSLDAIIDRAGTGTQVFIENLSQGFTSSPEDIASIIDGERRAYVALDIAHAYIVFARRKRVREYYGCFAEYIKDFISIIGRERVQLVHLHDVNAETMIEHVIPCRGCIGCSELREVFRLVNPRYLVIEAFRDRDGRLLSLATALEYSLEEIGWLVKGS